MFLRKIVSAVLAAATAAVAPTAWAIDPIPRTPGWGGFVVGGVGVTQIKSNFVAGNTLFDVGRDTFNSIADAPRSDDVVHPVITGELNYTFQDQLQVFFGTSLEDALTLDGVTQLGARKDFGTPGVLQAGFLFSGIPTQTWEDPYAEGVRRKETDRDSTGFRVQWDRILGSDLQLTMSYRDIAIDRERSGEGVSSVTCNLRCRNLLRRDGDQVSFDASYLFRLGQPAKHLLRPMLRYTVHDRDGKAISGDAYRAQLSYVYLGDGYTLVTNAALGASTQDERNPLFNRKTDSDLVALDATLLYRLPPASGRWQAVATLLWGEEDNDVSFHDNEAFFANVGVMYRFGAR
jgi:hypothetical protein